MVDDARRVLGGVSDTEPPRRVGGTHHGLLDRLMRRGRDGHALHGMIDRADALRAAFRS